jgi:hypothetical protein
LIWSAIDAPISASRISEKRLEEAYARAIASGVPEENEPKGLSPAMAPCFFLEPFEGGVSTDLAFAFPHRPVPDYPFPTPIE